MVDAAHAPSPVALVEAAEVVADRLRSGGRLFVTGEGRSATDARHVAVEFMHPVTVGKRALPALVGGDGATPGDVRLSIAYGGSRLIEPADVALSDHPPEADSTAWLPFPGDDPGAAKVAAVLGYHTLWELVQLDLESIPADDAGAAAASALYPMIYPSDPDGGDGRGHAAERRAAAIASASAKLAESEAICARTLEDAADDIERAAELIGAASRVYTFGNGGSSTDAADAALAIGSRARSTNCFIICNY